MIDTDKYEGHTEGPWKYNTDDDGWTLAGIRERDDPDRDEFIALVAKPNGNPYLTMNPDLALIADAPLLLEEVKRLRDALRIARDSLVWSDEDFIVDEAFAEQIESVRDNIAQVLED